MSIKKHSYTICEERISPKKLYMAVMSPLLSTAVGAWHVGNACRKTEIAAKNSQERNTRLSFGGKNILSQCI